MPRPPDVAIAAPERARNLIKKLILKRGSQASFAKKVGMSPSALSQILSGETKSTDRLGDIVTALKPTPEERIAIMLALDLPVQRALGTTDDTGIGEILNAMERAAELGPEKLRELGRICQTLVGGLESKK